MTEETLTSVRRRIGEIDEEIMRLVCSRIKEAEKIGKIKRDRRVPVRDFTVNEPDRSVTLQPKRRSMPAMLASA